eukprot:2809341-Amphidinium_carterae.1
MEMLVKQVTSKLQPQFEDLQQRVGNLEKGSSAGLTEERVREIVRELTPPRSATPTGRPGSSNDGVGERRGGRNGAEADFKRSLTVRGWECAARRDDIIAGLTQVLQTAK